VDSPTKYRRQARFRVFVKNTGMFCSYIYYKMELIFYNLCTKILPPPTMVSPVNTQGSTSTSHHIWPNPCTQQSTQRQIGIWYSPVRMVQKKGLWSKKYRAWSKKRGLVQKKGLWSKKYFDGPNTCWDDIHISLLLFTLRYFGPENISTLRFFFLKVVFYFSFSFFINSRFINFQIFIFKNIFIIFHFSEIYKFSKI
jgi:hypothetical protein